MDRTVEMNKKVALLKEKVGNNIFNRNECYGITTITTLKKYGYIERCEEEKITEYTLEEIVEMLNKTIEEDCSKYFEHGYSYEYKAINGKPCKVEHFTGYRFKN